MLSGVIENVRAGLMTPEAFRKAEMTRRVLNFSLSSTAVVDPIFSSGLFTIDLDWTRRFLLSGASDGSWYIHDTFNFTQSMDHSKKCILYCPARTTHRRSISTVEWYPADNGVFTTSSFDGWVCLWDANSPSRPVERYNRVGPVYRHHTNPLVGRLIAVCSGGEINLIDTRAGTAIQKLPDVQTELKEVRWSPTNQSQLMVGSRGGHLIEWDIRSTIEYRCYGVDEVKSGRKPVVTRRYSESTAMVQAHNGSIDSMRFSTNGHELFTFADDGRIRRWKVGANTDPCIGTLHYGKKSKGHGNFAIDITDKTDPPIVFAPQSTSICICDMKDFRVVKELVGHFKQVNCFIYDDLYQQGYSGGNDAGVMVWSGNTMTEQTYTEEKTGKYDERRGRKPEAKPEPASLIQLDDDDD